MMTDASITQFDIARTYQEVLDCWRLVYQCYTRKGLIDANPQGIHTCPQPFNLDTIVIHGRTHGRIDTTLTMIPDGPHGLPLDQVYPEFLERLRGQNCRLLEVGLLADDRAQGDKARAQAFGTMRLAAYRALYTRSYALIGVHPHHSDFYVRMMGFEVIGPMRSYPKVNNRLVVLLLLDPAWIRRERLPRLLRYIKENPVEASLFDQSFDLRRMDVPGPAISSCLNDTAEATEPRRFRADDVQTPMQQSAVC